MNIFAHNGHDHTKEALAALQNSNSDVWSIGIVAVLLIAGIVFGYMYYKKKKK